MLRYDPNHGAELEKKTKNHENRPISLAIALLILNSISLHE